MNVKVFPNQLNGSVPAIASKSYAHRILIAAALANKPTNVYLNGVSKDIEATVEALTDLGAEIKQNDKGFIVTPIKKLSTSPTLFCGESGTTARLLLPVLAALYEKATLNGSGSLVSRPFATLCETLQENGCNFLTKSLPITYTGKINPGIYRISGGESSQYISGLMFALPLLKGSSKIELTSPLQSSGYVQMTRQVLSKFKVDVSPTINHSIYQSPSDIIVEGDWSNAAFWLAAGVEVTGLNHDSLQKDKMFLAVKDQDVIDVSDIPDLVPILAVYAASKTKTVRFINAQRLKIKESNRMQTVSSLINNLGGKAKIEQDELIIYGTGGLKGGVISSFNDHRIVMAAAIASTISDGEITILQAQAVNKSYPQFFEDFKTLGGQIDVI